QTTMVDQVRHILEDGEVPAPDVANASRILRRLQEALAEVEFGTLVDAIASEGGQEGPQSMIGNVAPINIIPGAKKGKCRSLLLAFALGRCRRGILGLPTVMTKVKTHLIECSGITRVVILVADTWDSAEFFAEYFDELKAHHRKGVRFVFLLAG